MALNLRSEGGPVNVTGPEFRNLLAAAELNQSQLAVILGVAPNTVSRWANETIPVARYAVAYLDLLAGIRAALPSQRKSPVLSSS